MVLLVLVILICLAALPYYLETRRKPMNAQARRAAPGQFVELSQGVTHALWHGPTRGPVAVCIHGLTTPSFVWDGLVDDLGAMGYRVLCYDLFGRGYSDRPEGEQDAAFFLRQLEDLLEAEEIDEEITLIGHSAGGAIATAYAAKHSGRVRHLVLLAPGGLSTSRDALTRFVIRTPYLGDWLMRLVFPGRLQRSIEVERALPGSGPAIADRQQQELNYRGFVPAVLATLRGLLAQPQEAEHRAVHRAGVPVLAIWGREDRVVSLSAMGKLTEWSRMARQEVIDGAGHGLPYTHTQQVATVLRERLREGLN